MATEMKTMPAQSPRHIQREVAAGCWLGAYITFTLVSLQTQISPVATPNTEVKSLISSKSPDAATILQSCLKFVLPCLQHVRSLCFKNAA